MDKKNLKILIALSILVPLFLFLGYTVSRGYINKNAFEKDILEIASKNEEKIFEIKELTMFSSADSVSEVRSNSTLNIDNLFQYTDIAIFLKPVKEDLDLKNTLKDVYINNIKFVKSPEEGTPCLYYKSLTEFATSKIVEENLIKDELHFAISSEDVEDLSTPTLYNNCANPITLSYVNSNIKKDYTLPDAFSQISYDGSLLKRCGVLLNSIESSLSFDIHVTNNLDQNFVCPIHIEIPLETKDGNTLYDGKLLLKNETNYTFYRYN